MSCPDSMHRRPFPSPAYGWLLLAPVLVAVLFQIGRGVGNTGFVIAWLALAAALVATRAAPGSSVRGAGLLWLALLAWGGYSAAASVAPAGAVEYWLRYAWVGSVFFIVTALLRQPAAPALDWLLARIGWIGLASLGWLLGHTVLTYDIPGFEPQLHIHGLVPAYLAPFVLYWLARRLDGWLRVLAIVAYSVLLAWLLVRIDSLTEVLALAAALLVLAWAWMPTPALRLALPALLLSGFVALILAFDPSGEVIVAGPDEPAAGQRDWVALADTLSSRRTLIWRQALAMPPPDPWLGVGAGNVHRYPPVQMDGFGAVKHLHNLFLDVWYEIGLLGLGLYLALLASQAVPALRRRDAGTTPVLLATVAAILVAAMLEQSYRSIHLALVLPFLFALFARRLPAQAPAPGA